MARVVVLGGGFGGLAAATELVGRLGADHEVVLVARDDRFAMGFAKLWDLAGIRPLADGTRSLHLLEGRGVRFLHAEVAAIEPAGPAVTTTAGELEADALVIALGAAPAPAHRRLLDGPDAHDLYDPAALPAIREAITGLDSGRVVVSILGGPFKCPPAPYEAALIVDTLLRDREVRDDIEVVLTTPQPMTLPAAGVDASRYIAEHLADHAIALRSGVRVADVQPGQLTLEPAPLPGGPAPGDGAVGDLGFDLLLGVPADTPPAVLATSPLAAASGWVEPDPRTLRTGFDRVYAVGDCTAIPTPRAQLPHAGVFAAAQARVAAANVAADLLGSEPERFDGHGRCFLELPGRQVAFVEGDFYADPPDVRLLPADQARFEEKQAYERDQLAAWFG